MDASGGADLAAALEQRLLPAIRSVTIDLAALESVSLGAVRAFLQIGRSLHARDLSLQFMGGPEAVRHAFEHAGFAAFFPFDPPLHSHRGHHVEPS